MKVYKIVISLLIGIFFFGNSILCMEKNTPSNKLYYSKQLNGGVLPVELHTEVARYLIARHPSWFVWLSNNQATNASRIELLGHTDWISSINFDSCGKKMITASYDKTARIWDFTTGNCLTAISEQEHIKSAQFNPSEDRVITITNHLAKAWDTATGIYQSLFEGHTNAINSARYNSTGILVVTASDDKTARIWNAKTGECLKILNGHTARCSSAQFTLQNDKILTVADDCTARIWDVETGICEKILTNENKQIMTVHLNPMGSHVVGSSLDNSFRVWNICCNNSTDRTFFDKDVKWIKSAQYNSSGKLIITSSDDNNIKIWNSETGERIRILAGHKAYIKSVQCDTLGNKIVTAANDKTVRIWDIGTGECLKILNGNFASAQFDPTGTRIITMHRNGAIAIWDIIEPKLYKEVWDSLTIDKPQLFIIAYKCLITGCLLELEPWKNTLEHLPENIKQKILKSLSVK
jgi:WD40 repeat protein